MIDGEIGDHPFQVGLRPGGERSENDGANGEAKQPWSERLDFAREKWKEQTHETVNAHLGEHARQDHRNSGWGGFVCVRQPGVKGKKWDLHRQSEKDSRE